MRFGAEITLSNVGSLENFPWIKPSDYMPALASVGEFSKLLGGKTLQEAALNLKSFWERFRVIFPQHEIFEINSNDPDFFSKCIPCYAHGDEGTGYKKKGVLILSWQPVLGFGGGHSPNVHVQAWLTKNKQCLTFPNCCKPSFIISVKYVGFCWYMLIFQQSLHA